MTIQPVITEDGSSTFFIPELNEHYHSIHGAVQESMHIFIQSGYQQILTFPVQIFEERKLLSGGKTLRIAGDGRS